MTFEYDRIMGFATLKIELGYFFYYAIVVARHWCQEYELQYSWFSDWANYARSLLCESDSHSHNKR